ncbi:hypothetical protein ACOSP7_013100 [Xanthoceras sorbifolium]
MPLIHGRVSKHTYKEVLDKAQRKLAGWKSATLSITGRTTLVKAVLFALPIYTMQAAKIPVEICKKIDRDFIWGHNEAKKPIHLINWRTICLPKSLGGLGVKKMEPLNQALLAKLSWRMSQREDSLWCNMLTNKYLVGSPNGNSRRSSCWRGICHGFQLLQKGLS